MSVPTRDPLPDLFQSAKPADLMQDKWKVGLSLVRPISQPSEPPEEIISEHETQSSILETDGTDATSEESAEQLPDLTQIAKPSDAELRRTMQQEADRKKQWAQQAGAKLFELEREYDQLETMANQDPDIALSDSYQRRRKILEEAIAKIGSVGEELRKRVAFSRLVQAIRSCDPTSPEAISSIIQQALAAEQYRHATLEEISASKTGKRWPEGTTFHEGKALIPIPPAKPAYLKARRLFRWEFTQLLNKALRAKRDEMRALQDRATQSVNKLGRGVLGLYYLEGDRRGDCVLVELFDANRNKENLEPFCVVRFVEALGLLSPLADESMGVVSVPFYWVRAGQPLSKTPLTAEQQKRTEYLIRVLRRLVETNREKSTAAAPK